MANDQVPESAQIGRHVVIEDDVVLGERVELGHFCVLLKGTVLGDDVKVGPHTVLGIQPRGSAHMRQTGRAEAGLRIGDRTRIGSHATIYAGSSVGSDAFVGDHASIREAVTIGNGTVVGRGAMVELNTSIGERCTIQTLAYVTGDTVLEDGVFIGPCVAMSNDKYMGAKPFELIGPRLRRGAKIGSNATLLPGVVVGADTIVGAGSVVTRNTASARLVTGVPARPRSYGD